MKIPLCQIDLAQTISEWKDVSSNKEDDQYLGDICFSLRYVPTSGKLTVGILECKRLKKMDITGASGMHTFGSRMNRYLTIAEESLSICFSVQTVFSRNFCKKKCESNVP